VSLTRLRNLVEKLRTIRPAHDAIDRALMIVEIYVDESQGLRAPTRDELDRWFLENYDPKAPTISRTVGPRFSKM